MSRLDDLLAAALAPRAPAARKTKRPAEADLLASLTLWTPPAWAPYPPMARGGTGRQRALPEYVSPRERPDLAHRCAGPEAVSDEIMAAWIACDPFVRGGLSARTVRAICFIETFAPRTRRPPCTR
jgi:hypothetical protein